MIWLKPWMAAGFADVDKMPLDQVTQPMQCGDAREVLHEVWVALKVQKSQGQKCIT
jgi:hypothetical protein